MWKVVGQPVIFDDFCKSSRPMEVFVGQLGHCCGMMGLVGEICRVCFLFAKLRHTFDISHTMKYPIPSMYGIFTYIWFTFMLNVGRYTTHGSYGYIADSDNKCICKCARRGKVWAGTRINTYVLEQTCLWDLQLTTKETLPTHIPPEDSAWKLMMMMMMMMLMIKIGA